MASAAAIAAVAASIFVDARLIAREIAARDSGITIRIDDIGEWWRIEYDRAGERFVTANELHVPVAQRVTFEFRGRPALCTAKNFLVLDGRSVFVAAKRGIDHAHVIRLWPLSRRRLTIIADDPREFERWLDEQRHPAARNVAAPLFISAGCSFCHVLRGVAENPDPAAPPAPDLTHFGSRLTIAATNMPNRPGFLSGWIVDSQSLKRGSVMPPNQLDAPVLHRLTRYLESLR